MGFDIYGMNPVIKEGSVKPERPGDDVSMYDQQEVWDEYFNLLGKYEDENPGVYFRANVWFWRPIAEWLVKNIEVLDEEDIHGLSYNEGHIINENVAKIIGSTIKHHDEEGFIDEWIQHNKILQALRDKQECTICDGTGVRRDQIAIDVGLEPFTKNGIEGYKCNACNGEGVKEAFENNYPYSKKALVEFGIFASQSGGFQIC